MQFVTLAGIIIMKGSVMLQKLKEKSMMSFKRLKIKRNRFICRL